MTPRVVVYTKPGCHLCEQACDAVAAVVADTGDSWSAHDISSDRELMARWAEYVPVILVDGEVHDWFRVRSDRLREALSA
jgi:hypothetical protein